MIHKKVLTFSKNGVDFEAVVEYNDEPFGNYLTNKSIIYYKINLIKPVEMDCGGCQIVAQNSISALQFSNKKYRECRYICEENEVLESENVVNIYPLAKEKILYQYFNKDVIEEINEKIQKYNNEIDKKYYDEIEKAKHEKTNLKKRLKANEFDNKKYQKLLTPIRKEKEKKEFEAFYLKFEYKCNFFNGYELKDKYRKDI